MGEGRRGLQVRYGRQVEHVGNVGQSLVSISLYLAHAEPFQGPPSYLGDR